MLIQNGNKLSIFDFVLTTRADKSRQEIQSGSRVELQKSDFLAASAFTIASFVEPRLGT